MFPARGSYEDHTVLLFVHSGVFVDRIKVEIDGYCWCRKTVSMLNLTGNTSFMYGGVLFTLWWKWGTNGKPKSIALVSEYHVIVLAGDTSILDTIRRKTGIVPHDVPRIDKPDVFISYRRQDLPLAKAVYEGLVAAGRRPWLDLHDLRSGEPFQQAITTAIYEVEAVVVIASPWSIGKDYGSAFVLDEWRQALNLGKRVLLVVVQSLSKNDVQMIEEYFDSHIWERVMWVDVRQYPEQISALVEQWLQSPSAAHRDKELELPTDPVIPDMARQAGSTLIWSSLLLAAMCIAALFFLLVFIPPPKQENDANAINMMVRRGQILYLIITAGLTLLMTAPQGRRFLKREFNRLDLSIGILKSLSRYFPVVFLLPFLVGAAAAVIVNERDYFFAPFYAVAGCIGLAFMWWLDNLARTLKDSYTLKLWTPTYPISALPRLARAENELRGGTSVGPTLKAPARTITVIYAATDGPLAQYLQTALGFPISADGDAAVVLMTNMLMHDSISRNRINTFNNANKPLVLVQLENCSVWPELCSLNWVDAMNNWELAVERIRSSLNAQPPQTMLTQIAAPIKGEFGIAKLPFPDTAIKLGIASPVFKLSLVSLTVPLSYGTLGRISTTQILAFLIFEVLVCLQMAALTLVIGRRISLKALVNAYLGLSLVSLIPLAYLWPMIEEGYLQGIVPFSIVWLFVAVEITIAALWKTRGVLHHWLPTRVQVRKHLEPLDLILWVYTPMGMLILALALFLSG